MKETQTLDVEVKTKLASLMTARANELTKLQGATKDQTDWAAAVLLNVDDKITALMSDMQAEQEAREAAREVEQKERMVQAIFAFAERKVQAKAVQKGPK